MANTLLDPHYEEIFEQAAAFDSVTRGQEPFAQLTTLHLGGTPLASFRCFSQQAAVEVVKLFDAHRIPLLVVGGGSNLVVADGDVPLAAVILDFDAIDIDAHSARLRADAGAVWDEVVETAVAAGLGGIECLSGIPGSAGATPVQNVGAYGCEIADVLVEVTLYDRQRGQIVTAEASELDLAYRYSNLKFTQRAVVLDITLQLHNDGLSAPLRFGELARRLDAEAEQRLPIADVRDAVLALRRGKGMVYQASDHDTWSAGSFFTNPILSPEQAKQVREAVATTLGEELASTMPAFEVAGGVKLSAAWLIDKAGFTKGYPGPEAPARLSTKHTLALTNRGNASTADLVALARDVRGGVAQVFGVTLEPEPVWVGVSI
ncbi:UDP-N-acetylmuramate dehydrogenase [Corynebacterium pelargi]|uniref:UDP-N-acetylenolpyruvoylglucosamine reductase n=1 Tax=Corynebacterium pelargi TaxID=1471400 RepID=A0A410WBD3_9CORY|nr:UDP-N-acetylenolpyruvoylglucosamine reductase [Corynebacterium pelargi]